jgi:hypothetical protein
MRTADRTPCAPARAASPPHRRSPRPSIRTRRRGSVNHVSSALRAERKRGQSLETWHERTPDRRGRPVSAAEAQFARRRNCSRSRIARSISPVPSNSPESSKAWTVKVTRPSAGSDGSAVMSTLRPSGVGRRCVIRTAIPTDVWPELRTGAAASTVAASIQVTRRNVASTGTSPVPSVIAMSASVTVNRTRSPYRPRTRRRDRRDAAAAVRGPTPAGVLDPGRGPSDAAIRAKGYRGAPPSTS